jgi:hypothetical protein
VSGGSAAAGKLAGKTNNAVNATDVSPSVTVRTLRRIDAALLASDARDITRAVKFTVIPEFPDSCAQLPCGLGSALPRPKQSPRAVMDVLTERWMAAMSSVVTEQ